MSHKDNETKTLCHPERPHVKARTQISFGANTYQTPARQQSPD